MFRGGFKEELKDKCLGYRQVVGELVKSKQTW